MEGRSRSTSPSRYCTSALHEEYIFVFLALKRDCFFSVVFGSGLAHSLKLLLLYQKNCIVVSRLFRLSILFSQHRSRDDTAEVELLLYSLKRPRARVKTFNFERNSPGYRHFICIVKTKSTSERVLFSGKFITTFTVWSFKRWLTAHFLVNYFTFIAWMTLFHHSTFALAVLPWQIPKKLSCNCSCTPAHPTISFDREVFTHLTKGHPSQQNSTPLPRRYGCAHA